jgi:peptidoglycan/xylan/chitin deacetylase (PgdA/CDA1 family)
MVKLLSKEPKSRLRKHLELLVLLFILSISLLLLSLVLDYKEIIYPQLHRNQISPKEYVKGRVEVIEHGSRDKPLVALTFDADMTPAMALLLKQGIVKSWYNKPIKDTLDKENVKATIFLGGLWSKIYPKEARDLAQDPLIEIGNHSYNHYAFTKGCYELGDIDNAAGKDDVGAAQTIILAVTEITPKYFRFPGGCFDKEDLESVVKLGLKVVHWDVVANDGFNNNTDSIVWKVLNNVQNGSIVVFHIHDGPYAPKTNDALKIIIPKLKEKGFKFVTISEMLK